jgi:hypothetical protein
VENLKKLLDALAPENLISEAAEPLVEEPLPANVLHFRRIESGDRGELFTPTERARIRDMLEAFEAIKNACPMARRAAADTKPKK